jgi:hypothetical protein
VEISEPEDNIPVEGNNTFEVLMQQQKVLLKEQNFCTNGDLSCQSANSIGILLLIESVQML